MSLYHLTDGEIALRLATSIKEWRISPRGAALSRDALVRKSGVGLTPLKRFESTGATTMGNCWRALNIDELCALNFE